MNPILIEKFLPEDILNIYYSYCIFKFMNEHVNFDHQANSLAGVYSDFLSEVILDLSTPVIEKNVGKKLFPTYTFTRVYDKNSRLPVHTDRPACEYTVALCIGAAPNNIPYDIFVGEEDNTSVYRYLNNQGQYKRYKIEHKFSMLPNNALIFKGLEKLHWREECTHDHYITVFLHYVDQDGEYKEWAFDKRKELAKEPTYK
jgi:hypothetical protein